MIKTVEWLGQGIKILDQTRLPGQLEYVVLETVEEVAEAIASLKVRGAPLIGVTAAWGLVLGAYTCSDSNQGMTQSMEQYARMLRATRPTAINLDWAITRMMKVYYHHKDRKPHGICQLLAEEAALMQAEDLQTNLRIGEWGAKLLGPESRVMTICNAGALATCGHGTALGIIRTAFSQSRVSKVWICETRPVLQGARLTAWELTEDQIPATLVTDSMAGYIMQLGLVDAVIAGADRIALNGDTANKIGTYSLAVLARHHRIPFYIAAPTSTIDWGIKDGSQIPIEERNADEIRTMAGSYITLPMMEVFNPAFDVTNAELISAIITEKGVARPPFGNSLAVWSR